MTDYRVAFDSGAWEWAAALAGAGLFAALLPKLRTLPRVLAALRCAAAALLALALLKPALHRMEERLSRPTLAVLVDQGPSMASLDDQGLSRLSRAVRWLKENRRLLEERAEVVLMAAGGGARRLTWEELDGLKPGATALDPASVFSDVSEAAPAAARVLLLSDGAFGQEEALAAAGRAGAPLDALGAGPLTARRSLSISGVEAPDFVFIHGRFPVTASVDASQLKGGSVSVRLRRGGEQVAEQTFAVASPFETLRASFTVEATALGRQGFRVEAYVPGASYAPGTAAQTSEISRSGPSRTYDLPKFGTGSGTAPAASGGEAGRAGDKPLRAARELGVEVIRQKYRIMYLAGRPSFEYSHLRALLKADPNHELVSFVILRNPENVAPVPDNELSLIPFPATEIFEQSLFQFDLFILENFAYWKFHLPPSYLENLRRFVAQGGALLVIGGSNAFTQGGYQGTPLEETLPVTLWPDKDDFSPGLFEPLLSSPAHPLLRLGETAEASSELWKALPPLDGFSRFGSVRPGATVLLSHPTEKTAAGQPLPVVAVREYGRGKVMLVGTESTWRWKLAGGRDWRVSSFYPRFWGKAVEYLTGSLELRKVKFSPLPDRMPEREPAVLTLHVFDEHFRPVRGSELDIRLGWTQPGGRAQRLPPFFEREPGVFQVELNDLAEGPHKVRAAVRYRGQLWGEDTAEFNWEKPKGEAPLDRRLLKALADKTSGSYADLAQARADRVADALPPVRRELSVLSRVSLWTSSAWLWLACGLLLLEWMLRRRKGYL